MPRFDDELRATLRGRAQRIEPPTDPIPGIERRARRIRRVRGVAATGTALAIVAATPVVYRQFRAERAPVTPQAVGSRSPARLGTAAPSKATVFGATASSPPTAFDARSAGPESAGGGSAGDPPRNRLDWPARGTTPPTAFAAAVTAWYAADARAHHGTPTGLHRDRLWSGELPDGRWLTLDQVWNPTDLHRAGTWSTVLLVGHANGGALTAPYDLPTRFRHRPGDTAGGADTRAIAGYGFRLGDCVLLIGSPDAARAVLTGPDGRHAGKRLHDGAAVFTRPADADAYRLTSARGTTLTPDDGHHGAGQGWHLDLIR